jgi:hypothetical protein
MYNYGDPKINVKKSIGKERLTLQFRKYDKSGKYDLSNDVSNATIHIKDMDIGIAYEIVKNALLNSPYISKRFEIED